jgi:tetratricopeptide (TPR) repeat protein
MICRAAAALGLALAALAPAGCAATEAEELGVETYIHNAQGYVDGGHYAEALGQFRNALALDPDNRKALLGEATCLYWTGMAETSEGGRAVEEAEAKAEALDPEGWAEGSWKVHLLQGMVRARLADLWSRKAEAARCAGAEGRAPPDAAEAAAAQASERADAYDRAAVRAFEHVLTYEDQPLARNNLTALFQLASRGALRARSPEDYVKPREYLARFEKEVERSKALWREMKLKEPRLAGAYDAKLKSAEKQEADLRDLVANILFKSRRHEESIAQLDRVIELDPSRAAALYNRGRNHEELGRFGLAADDYGRFLRLTDLPSGSPAVLEAVERMKACEAKAAGAAPPR